MLATLTPDKKFLNVQFSYRPALVEAMRGLRGRWDPTIKQWAVPADPQNIARLAELGCMGLLDAQEAIRPTPEQTTTAEQEFKQIQPTLIGLGELVGRGYTEGWIDQATQAAMIEIINHISCKDFINK